jgi:hypothetical protein
MKCMIVALGVLGFVSAATATAQAQEAKPGPELKKLDIWVGDWTWEDQSKDSETGEEQTTKGTGQYSRMGEFFYVWQSKGEQGSFTAFYGYDPIKKAYFTHGFNSDGWRGTATLTFGDKTVTNDWTGVTAAGEKTRRRCTADLVVPKSTSACEDFIDGKWTAATKGTFTKVK